MTLAMQGKRVGVYMDLATRPKSDPDVQALFMQAIDDMEAAGAEIVMNVSLKVRLFLLPSRQACC